MDVCDCDANKYRLSSERFVYVRLKIENKFGECFSNLEIASVQNASEICLLGAFLRKLNGNFQ